jgi:hypothetical protein
MILAEDRESWRDLEKDYIEYLRIRRRSLWQLWLLTVEPGPRVSALSALAVLDNLI